MYIVFLNSKLISCDTIMPLMMELNHRTGRRVRFLVRDFDTLGDIKLNRYLWDAINQVGTIEAFQRKRMGPVGWFTHRSMIAGMMLKMSLQAVFGKVHFFHFRALNFYPLRALTWFNKERTVFCESDSYGEPEIMARVGGLGVNRGYKAPPVAGRVVAFSRHFAWLKRPEIANTPTHIFGPTRTRKIWLDFVQDRLQHDWRDLFESRDLAVPEKAFVFMLGFFGYPGTLPKDPEDLPEILFGEVLDAIDEVAPGEPVILKPHVFTDMSVVERQIAKRPHMKIVVSYLHPTALALKARAVITNLYSTTQADAKSLGVPTIEYSEYSDEALHLSEGGSMNPDMIDHFIQRDPSKLRSVLQQCLSRETGDLIEGVFGDETGLLEVLS